MNDEQLHPGGKDIRSTEIAEGLPSILPRDHAMEDEPLNITVREPSARDVFFAWERLRLYYNAVLVGIVLAMCRDAVIAFLDQALLAAIAANLMFCAGPVCESYLSMWGVPRLAARWIVFGLGIVVSIGITILSAQEMIRNFP